MKKDKMITLTGYKNGKQLCSKTITGWSNLKKWHYKRKMEKKLGVDSWTQIELFSE